MEVLCIYNGLVSWCLDAEWHPPWSGPCCPRVWLWYHPCFSLLFNVEAICYSSQLMHFSNIEANIMLKPFFAVRLFIYFLFVYFNFTFGLPPPLPPLTGCLLHRWANACSSSASSNSTLLNVEYQAAESKEENLISKSSVKLFDRKSKIWNY